MKQHMITTLEKLRTNAAVRRTSGDADTGRLRIGVRMIKASIGLRIAASFLLCAALLGQMALARSLGPQADNSCTMSLARMKTILESILWQWSVASQSERAFLARNPSSLHTVPWWTLASNSEKAFLHVQHERMSCEEYTRLYEQSNFYGDKHQREALSRWHWNQYHSKDEATRAAAVSELNAMLDSHGVGRR